MVQIIFIQIVKPFRNKTKISFKNFENLNLNIAEIVKAKKVKKTKKLMELEVKLGKKPEL